MTVNYAKAVFAGVVVICVTVLLATAHMSETAGVGLITFISGYILGNGVQARKGGDVPGIIRPRPSGRRADDPGHET